VRRTRFSRDAADLDAFRSGRPRASRAFFMAPTVLPIGNLDNTLLGATVKADNKELPMSASASFETPFTPSTVAVPSFASRAAVVVRSLATLARDPGRLDQVLALTQAVNVAAVSRAIARISQDPKGRRLLAEQPRIDRAHVDFDALRALPDGTLGREYTRFLDENGITPDVFEALPDVGDARAAYIMLRMRQSHDLWHVLTGYAPDVRGEVLLQAFTYAQTGGPSALLITLFGTVRWGYTWPRFLSDLRAAFTHGREAAFLPTFRWEERWSTPVDELRRELRCPRAVVQSVRR